jgi:hypothetical protein
MESGPDAEFHVSRRQELIAQVQAALQANVDSVIWSCLWLSDLTKLEEIVQLVRERNMFVILVLRSQMPCGIVRQCLFVPYTFMMIGAN